MQLTISELIRHLEYAQREMGVRPTDLVLFGDAKQGHDIQLYAGGKLLVIQESCDAVDKATLAVVGNIRLVQP